MLKALQLTSIPGSYSCSAANVSYIATHVSCSLHPVLHWARNTTRDFATNSRVRFHAMSVAEFFKTHKFSVT
jgi:hypothetical protein